MRHDELTSSTPTEQAKALLRQPPGPWPDAWEGYPNIEAAFRELFAEAAGQVPAPPAFPIDRGIVICAGGWRFFPSLYVTIRIIRHVGCELPIQVWYLGDRQEFDVRMAQALDPWGVGWIDANAFVRDNGIHRRLLGGWELKPLAAAYCPFRTVLSLDADSYPAYNPECFLDHPEFRRVGAAFWPDQKPLEPGQWDRFGIPRHQEPAWESGQFAVDKSRHWGPLWLAAWINDYSDYVYKHVYGDKDTYHLAWRRMGHEVCIPQRKPGWDQVAFLQRDFAGHILFVHRTRCKFRWDGDIDGATVPNGYSTAQNGAPNRKVPSLPHEEIAHEFCRESSELLRPERHWQFRPGTWDREIWMAVNLRNEYRLPRSFGAEDVILDVGGHIGSFAHACLSRGAGLVVSVEPDADNLANLRKHLARWDTKRWGVYHAAVWPTPGAMLSPAPEGPENTGGLTVCRGKGVPVSSLPLGQLLASLPGDRVRLLKLDCEGAEHTILAGVDLSRVQEIVGEVHPMPDRQAGDVRRHLSAFPHWEQRDNSSGLILFRAWR